MNLEDVIAARRSTTPTLSTQPVQRPRTFEVVPGGSLYKPPPVDEAPPCTDCEQKSFEQAAQEAASTAFSIQRLLWPVVILGGGGLLLYAVLKK